MKTSATNSNYKPSKDSDSLNPAFIFESTATELLVAMVNGQIDPVYMVKVQLANRGLDLKGNWIGFDKAEVENFKFKLP